MFDLAIKQGKMAEERKQELLAKISMVASNDLTAFDGAESDIKVSKDSETGKILIDIVVHWIQTDPEEADMMNVSYAAANSAIKNATAAQQEKASQLMQRIIQNTLKSVNLPSGEQERAEIQQNFESRGVQ